VRVHAPRLLRARLRGLAIYRRDKSLVASGGGVKRAGLRTGWRGGPVRRLLKAIPKSSRKSSGLRRNRASFVSGVATPGLLSRRPPRDERSRIGDRVFSVRNYLLTYVFPDILISIVPAYPIIIDYINIWLDLIKFHLLFYKFIKIKKWSNDVGHFFATWDISLKDQLASRYLDHTRKSKFWRPDRDF